MMTETKNTIAFYKTEIPGDWVVEKSGSVIKFFGGNAFSSDDACEEGIKWLKIANVGLEATKWNDVSFLPYEFIELHKKYLLKDGDVVMALTRPILDGKLKIAKVQKFDEPCLLNQRVAKLIPKASVDISFLYYVLQTPYYVYMMDIAMAGTDPPNIGNGDLEKIKIPLPPLPEQRAIAQVLSTADTAIHTTEKLIGQKVLRKKWLMQQLLTGKKRLKGFGEEWKEVRLKDVTTNFSRRNKDLVDAKVYSVTNKSGFVLQSDHFEGKVAGEDLSNYKIIKKNEFAYNPARVNVGSLAYFEEEIGVISSLYVCFKTTKDVLDYFLLQFLQIDHTKHRIEALGEGGVRVYLWYDLFSKIKIKIPSVEEQTAITQVLQAADKEISLLKAKAEKLREQKKGLMQQLLTGKVRLKVKE